MDENEIRIDHDPEERSGLSRRAFLKGGGILAGAAVLAGSGIGLTGCASDAGTASDGAAAAPASYTVYETDLLIIGAGIGALAAASWAVESGLNTTVVDKGPYGFGGGAGYNFDVIYTWYEDPASWPDLIPFQTVTAQDALKAAYETYPYPNTLLYLMNQGQMAPRRNEDGTVFLPYNFPQVTGIEGCFPRHGLDEMAKSQFITIHDRTMLTDILVNDGVCLGAMGIHLPTGELRVFRANATILAAGPNGWINGWSTVGAHSFDSPDNTSDIEIAAYRHGAAIGDSEYAAYDLISTYPTGIAYSFNSGLGADANEYEYILDKDGKVLLTDPSYDYKRFLYDRTYFNQIFGTEVVINGRGNENGNVYIDLSNPETLKGFREVYARSIDLWKENFGIDVSKEKVEIGLEMYERSGAPVIDAKAMSRQIGGLFCVRGGGTLGPDCGPNVGHFNPMGFYATRCAVEYLDGFTAPETIDWTPVADEYARLHELRTREADGGLRPGTVRHKIQNAAGTCMSVIRETAALEAAAAELERIRTEDMPKMILGTDTLTYNMDWKQAIENYNMLESAEMAVKATLMREESRGQYIRPDFPEKDDTNWKCMITATLTDGAMTFAKLEMPVVTW